MDDLQNCHIWQVTASVYGWNHPGSASLLAECHQIVFTLELLLGSFFDENARVLLRLSNEGERMEDKRKKNQE